MANRVLVKCSYCGKQFEVHAFKAKRDRIFCSRNCLISWLALEKKKTRVTVVCSQCGIQLERTPSQLKKGRNFCSRICYNRWRSIHPEEPSMKTKDAWASGKLTEEKCLTKAHEAVKGKPQSIEHRQKNAEAQRKAYEEGRKKPRPRTAWQTVYCDLCGKEVSLPIRQLKRTKYHFCNMGCFAQWCELNHRGVSNPFYGKRHTEETKALIGNKSKERMAILNAMPKPNKEELYLDTILNRYFSNQWQYVGDGKDKVAVERFNGLVPDWIHRNGKRMVLELFGYYWHTREGINWNYTELGRIMAYNSLGFKCLVIWDYELKNEQAVVAKVEQFMRRRS